MNVRSGGERQWAVPSAPWAMFQRWEKLLFAHWRVAPATVGLAREKGLWRIAQLGSPG
jgi:uncharacterized protein YqjF (DUF2071 family)